MKPEDHFVLAILQWAEPLPMNTHSGGRPLITAAPVSLLSSPTDTLLGVHFLATLSSEKPKRNAQDVITHSRRALGPIAGQDTLLPTEKALGIAGIFIEALPARIAHHDTAIATANTKWAV